MTAGALRRRRCTSDVRGLVRGGVGAADPGGVAGPDRASCFIDSWVPGDAPDVDVGDALHVERVADVRLLPDVDGRVRRDLPAGKHRVRFERTGFRPVSKQVQIASGHMRVLRVELIP